MHPPTEIRLVEVNSRKSLQAFIHLPWQIYRDNSFWVPPLIVSQRTLFNTRKHPFWKAHQSQFFLAYRGDTPVGRIVAICIRTKDGHRDEQTGFFGFLEAIDNALVFEKLIEQASTWLRSEGKNRILGPVNPSSNYEMGLLTRGFERSPFIMLPYTPPYYYKQLLALGFRNQKNFHAYRIFREGLVRSEKVERVKRMIRERCPVKLRTPNMKAFEAEIKLINGIYNDAMASHWGFVPMPPEEFLFMARDLKQIIDPELVLIAEYEDRPVGFLLALPNYNEVFARIRNGRLFPSGIFKLLHYRKQIEGVRVITFGIKSNYQNLGLGSLFYLEIADRIIQKGYQHAEISWIMEDNYRMRRPVELLGGELYKTYAIVGKSLDGP